MARMAPSRRAVYKWRGFGEQATHRRAVCQQEIIGERVYFVQMGRGGPIKIGTSTDLAGRLEALQDGAPDELILLGSIPGSYREEAELHRELAEYRRRGEWFEPHPEVVKAIGTRLGWWG